MFCLCFYAHHIVPVWNLHGVVSLRRYSFGPALFIAWIGGSVLVVGGVLNSLAFREMVKDGKPW